MNDQIDDLVIIAALERAARGPSASSRDAIRARIDGTADGTPTLTLVSARRLNGQNHRNRFIAFGAIVAAAAAAIIVVTATTGGDSTQLVPATEVSVSDPSLPTPAPAVTVPVVTSANTPAVTDPASTTPAAIDDPALLDRLTGHRWIVTAVDGRPWLLGATPFLEFESIPASGVGVSVGGSDGCNAFGLTGTIDRGALQFTDIQSTDLACGLNTGGVTPSAGDILRLGDNGSQLDLVAPGGSIHLGLVRSDALTAATATELVGRWKVGGTGDNPLVVFRDDGAVVFGTCGWMWSIDDTLVVSGLPADPYSCTGGNTDHSFGQLADALISGDATVSIDLTSTPRRLYINPDQSVITLIDANPVVSSDGITLAAATAFGFSPAQAVTPETVLAAVEPELGPVDHDTGWYNVPIVTYADDTADCLTGRDFRVLWWGDFSMAFWRAPYGESPTTTENLNDPVTLWAWSIGDRRVSGWGDRRERYVPPPEVRSGLETETGIGIGTAESTLLDTYAGSFVPGRAVEEGLDMATNGDDTVIWSILDENLTPYLITSAGLGVSVTTRDGVVTGIGASMQFC